MLTGRQYWLSCSLNNTYIRKYQQGHKIDMNGYTIYHYDQVSSTNAIARMMVQSGAAERNIVLSDFQAGGKGRLNREWSCPPGKGVLMSMILRPDMNVKDMPQLTLLVAVAVAECLHKVGNCVAGIKWPNDIIVNNKKICGILAESIGDSSSRAIIMGIGINVNIKQDEFPAQCRDTSTSLLIEAGHSIPRLQVVKEFLNSWDKHYPKYLNTGYPYLRDKWLSYNHTLGRSVDVSTNEGVLTGEAFDISPRGGLIVQLNNGSFREFLAEDVSLGKQYYN